MEGFIVELPERIKFDRAIDAVAQRYSMPPLEVLDMPQEWFFNALFFMSAENEVQRRKDKETKRRSRRR